MSTPYDYRARKTVAVLSNKILPGQALNVLGHLCIAIGYTMPSECMGRSELLDLSGVTHRGISKYPLIITRIKPSSIRKALERARTNPHLLIADFPRQMLDMGHDDDLASALSTADEPALEYLGIIIHGPTLDVNDITGKFSLWKDTPLTSPSVTQPGSVPLE